MTVSPDFSSARPASRVAEGGPGARSASPRAGADLVLAMVGREILIAEYRGHLRALRCREAKLCAAQLAQVTTKVMRMQTEQAVRA